MFRRQVRQTRGVALLMSLTLMAWGCQSEREELTAAELNERTAALMVDTVNTVAESVAFLENVSTVNVLAEGLSVIGQMIGVEEEEVTRNNSRAIPGTDEQADEQDLENGIREFLSTCLLVEDNLESHSVNNAVYLISGSVLCSDECFGDASDECVMNCSDGDSWCANEQQACLNQQAADREQCESDVDQIGVRIGVSYLNGEIMLTLLVGPQQSNVLSLGIQKDQVTLSTNLAQVKTAVETVSAVLDEQPIEIPGEVSGELAWVLKKHGPKDVSLTFQIRQAIQVQVDLPEDRGLIELSAQKALEALSVHVNGLAETLQLGVQIEPLRFLAPFAEFADSGSGDLILELAGLDGQLLLGGETNDSITISGFGWGDGPSRLRHDQTDIVSVELNANDDHHLDLSAQESNGMPLFSFDPAFQLDVYVNLGHLDPYLAPEEEPAPNELRDQTYSLIFAAQSEPAKLMPQPATETMADTIKIVHGTLELHSDASQANVIVEAGQCLLPVEECQASENFLLECLTAVDCP